MSTESPKFVSHKTKLPGIQFDSRKDSKPTKLERRPRNLVKS